MVLEGLPGAGTANDVGSEMTTSAVGQRLSFHPNISFRGGPQTL